MFMPFDPVVLLLEIHLKQITRNMGKVNKEPSTWLCAGKSSLKKIFNTAEIIKFRRYSFTEFYSAT